MESYQQKLWTSVDNFYKLMQFLEDKSIGTSVCLLDKLSIKVVVPMFIAIFY